MKLPTKSQYTYFAIGLKAVALITEVCTCGNISKISRDANSAITPNSLSGIDLKIA